MRAFGEAYRTFLTQPNAASVLAFLVFYRVGDIMMFGMAKFFLRDIGIDTAHRGMLNGFSIGASILGAIVGGAIISRKGLARCLTPMAYLQNLAIPLYFGLAIFRPRFAGIVPVVLVEQFVAGVGQTAFSVFQMQRCRADFSAAHFAFITAIVGGVSTLSGDLGGPAQHLGRLAGLLRALLRRHRAQPGAGVLRPEDADRTGADGRLRCAMPRRPSFVFAHGAGAPSSSAWMRAWRDGWATLGDVVAFDYPYMRAGRKAPDRCPC